MRPLALLLGVVLTGSAAIPARAAEPTRPVPARLRALAAELADADTARVQAAIEGLAISRHPYAIDALAAFLRDGQPDALADHALAALGDTRVRAALGVLAEFTRHRRPEARRQAYRSIALIEDPSADGLLANGLRDSDPRVRGACAEALGRRRASETLDVLFLALERGVPEAAVAIGRTGDAASVARLHEHLGREPLAVMLSGYEAFLRRNDVDEKLKLDIVARLGEVGVPAVKSFLQGLLATTDWRRELRVRAAVIETASRIADPRPPAGGSR